MIVGIHKVSDSKSILNAHFYFYYKRKKKKKRNNSNGKEDSPYHFRQTPIATIPEEMHATMEAKAENLQVSIQYQRLMWVNGAGGVRGEKKDKGNKRKVGKMRREIHVAHFERYSNETALERCRRWLQLAERKIGKEKEREREGEGDKTFEKKGS